MAVEIRLLQSGDESLLENVDPDVFDDPVNPQAAMMFLADPLHHIAVAVDHGLVVGFASGVHYFHPDKAAPELWVNEVGVASSHRGLGIGKSLLATLFEAAREKGCKIGWVLTNRENTAARSLYRAAGGIEEDSDLVMVEFQLPG